MIDIYVTAVHGAANTQHDIRGFICDLIYYYSVFEILK